MPNPIQYNAFISYSHADCGSVAPAIQRTIENIGKPWYWIGRRRLNVFRDQTNLSASPGLWEDILKALSNSKHFILLASPVAATSKWIKQEIDSWLQHNPDARIFIVVVKGEIEWSHEKNDFNWEKTNCLPTTLSKTFRSEPLWIDVRDYVNIKGIDYKQAGFNAQIAKIVAAILGVSPREIDSEELRRQRQTQLFLYLVTSVLIALVIATVFFISSRNRFQRISASNNLIAQGNITASSQLNKALLLYTYAYLQNPDTGVYKIVQTFYDQNTITSFVEDASVGTERDTINEFHKIINLKPRDTSAFNRFYTASGEEFPNVNSSEYDVDKKRLYLLTVADTGQNKFKGVQVLDIISNTITDIVQIEKNATGNALKLFGQPLNDAGFLDMWENGDPMIKATPKGNLIVYPFLSFFRDFSVVQYWYIDMQTKKMELRKLEAEHFLDYADMMIFSPDEQYLFVKSLSSGTNADNNNFVCNPFTGKVVKMIHVGSGNSASYGTEPLVVKWFGNSSLIYGTTDGQVVVDDVLSKGESSRIFSRAETSGSTITCIGFSDNYVVAGASNGYIYFWRNDAGDFSLANIRSGYMFLTSFPASNKPIKDIWLSNDSRTMLCSDNTGVVRAWMLKEHATLSKDPKALRQQVIGITGADLSTEEKARFGIKQ